MIYNEVIQATFLLRPNRFIANVLIDGKELSVHVRNTGRCRELLVPGCTVYLEKATNPERKTPYTLIAVEKIMPSGEVRMINMDSSVPNNLVEEWLKEGNIFGGGATVKREVCYGDSRFDFYIEKEKRKAFIEVKGVTLEKNGVAMFPDAPTERGVKHIRELIKCINDGYEGIIIFVIQMKGCHYFTPNRYTHQQFADTLKEGHKNGVKILAYDCNVTEDCITISDEMDVLLND